MPRNFNEILCSWIRLQNFKIPLVFKQLGSNLFFLVYSAESIFISQNFVKTSPLNWQNDLTLSIICSKIRFLKSLATQNSTQRRVTACADTAIWTGRHKSPCPFSQTVQKMNDDLILWSPGTSSSMVKVSVMLFSTRREVLQRRMRRWWGAIGSMGGRLR